MNKYDNGFGKPEKKVNPLKVLAIIWLVFVVVGVVIYARNYDYYYKKYKAFNNHEQIQETTEGTQEGTEDSEEATEDTPSQEGSLEE